MRKVIRHELVILIERTRINIFIRGRDGNANEENIGWPGHATSARVSVALSLGIGSCVESAGASSRR